VVVVVGTNHVGSGVFLCVIVLYSYKEMLVFGPAAGISTECRVTRGWSDADLAPYSRGRNTFLPRQHRRPQVKLKYSDAHAQDA